MSEASLAALLPIWRVVREDGVTALVTPALDYVGGLAVSPFDLRFEGEEASARVGEALRGFVSSLEDECTLHLLYRVTLGGGDDVAAYERASAAAEPESLRRYVQARAGYLSSTPLRRTSPTR